MLQLLAAIARSSSQARKGLVGAISALLLLCSPKTVANSKRAAVWALSELAREQSCAEQVAGGIVKLLPAMLRTDDGSCCCCWVVVRVAGCRVQRARDGCVGSTHDLAR